MKSRKLDPIGRWLGRGPKNCFPKRNNKWYIWKLKITTNTQLQNTHVKEESKERPGSITRTGENQWNGESLQEQIKGCLLNITFVGAKISPCTKLVICV